MRVDLERYLDTVALQPGRYAPPGMPCVINHLDTTNWMDSASARSRRRSPRRDCFCSARSCGPSHSIRSAASHPGRVYVPFPDSVTVCGLPPPSSATSIVAVLGPAAVGLKFGSTAVRVRLFCPNAAVVLAETSGGSQDYYRADSAVMRHPRDSGSLGGVMVKAATHYGYSFGRRVPRFGARPSHLSSAGPPPLQRCSTKYMQTSADSGAAQCA